MGVTISADGLSVIHQGSGGEAAATLPDVCLTTMGNSTVAVAYGNNAKSADLADGSATVMADGGQSLAIKGSSFSKSTGDAGGDKKGVTSGTIEAEAKFISASPTVKIEGKGVCRLSDQMSMNKANTMCLGGAQNPSVSVSKDEVGTFSFTLRCRYPSEGEPFKNAGFTIKDDKGKELSSGVTDNKGEAVISDMPPGTTCHVVYQESQDPFMLKDKRLYNRYRRSFLGDDDFFECALGSSNLFWRAGTSRASQEPFDFEVAFLPVLKCHILSSVTFNATEEVVQGIVNNLQLLSVQESPSLLSKLTVFVGISVLQDKEGGVVELLASLTREETKHNLMAMLRRLGGGNVEEYIKTFKWDEVNQRITKETLEFIEKTQVSMQALQHYASVHRGYTAYEESFAKQIDQLKVMKSKLTDWYQDVVKHLSERVEDIFFQADDVSVVLPHAHFSESHVLNTIVKTMRYEPNLFVDEVSNWSNNSRKRYIFQIGERGGSNWKDFEDYAKDSMKHNGIPRENIFTEYPKADVNGCYNQPTSNSLAKLDKFCRIDIPVHGNSSGPIDAGKAITVAALTKTLMDAGLKEVGVLRLDSCNVGDGPFLFLLQNHFRDKGIKVGYFAAPNGLLNITHLPLTDIRPVWKLPFIGDSWSVRKGTLDIAFPGTRYVS